MYWAKKRYYGCKKVFEVYIMKIEFIPRDAMAEKYISPPKPSKFLLPTWYKNMSLFLNNDNTYRVNPGLDAPNTTVKGCTPFLESLTLGYEIQLFSDIEIINNKENKIYDFKWMTPNFELISSHHPDQFPGLEKNDSYEDFIMKWNNEYVIKTPPGYSTLFFHPLNRADLPFYSFSGVVETDSYFIPINFPFLMKKIDNSIILEKGTPIIQFLPFKRDNWDCEILKNNEEMVNKNYFDLKSKIVRSYKKRDWKKKSFN